MKILVAAIKGGVGKTGIALNLATYIGAQCVTNDIVVNDNSDIIQLEPKKRSIPIRFCAQVPVVFDFGASYNSLDHKLAHAVKLSDVIAIPTLTDARSLQGTIDTVNLKMHDRVSRLRQVFFLTNRCLFRKQMFF